jgi:hypothetical protein
VETTKSAYHQILENIKDAFSKEKIKNDSKSVSTYPCPKLTLDIKYYRMD